MICERSELDHIQHTQPGSSTMFNLVFIETLEIIGHFGGDQQLWTGAIDSQLFTIYFTICDR